MRGRTNAEAELAMATILWDDEKPLYPRQRGQVGMLEEKLTEIDRKTALVGAIPSLFLALNLFLSDQRVSR